jgi:phosphohistidine phosphatase
MKTLFLIRHAKSSWDEPKLTDRQRPLAARGKRDARRLGKRLAKRYRRPDLMVSSPAVRALKTARLVNRKLDCQLIAVDARLYACKSSDLLRVIHQLDERHKRVMLFGHNPELSALARRFSDEIQHLPTCAAARFKFDTSSWTAVGRATLVAVALHCPERIRGSGGRSGHRIDGGGRKRR